MNAELEAIRDKWAEKTAAKYDGLVALQAAKAQEDGKEVGDDAIKLVATQLGDLAGRADLRGVHASRGIQGDEGRLDAEHLEMCDAYVAAHPGEFAGEIEGMSLEECVKAIDAFRAAGMTESEMRVEVWLRHKFEPQNIGGEVQARIRVAGL
jgi:copper chaperone CopZ